MKKWVKRSVSCFSPRKLLNRPAERGDGPGGEGDKCLQSEDLRNHAYGQFSTAVVQANEDLEDRFQVEIGRQATFVGVYDGHGGAHAAEYVTEHLLGHLTRLAREDGRMSEDIINNAFAATESGFRDHVRNSSVPAYSGACCLIGVIWKGRLFVANLGDCRAITARLSISSTTGFAPLQMTDDHNAGEEHIRHELLQLHRDDPRIVFVRNSHWRVKGILQVTRSIGDFYLKHQEFHLGPSFPKYHVPEPIVEPVVRSDPELYVREIKEDPCRFYIFASDGLWQWLNNQAAIDMVRQYPREGIARRLAVRAMTLAAAASGKDYAKMKQKLAGTRRRFHDDITVVVIFVDRLQPLDEGTSTSVQSNFDF